jgi:group I intron endonuclease
MEKKLSGVYLVKNRLNEKCYVGVSVNIHSRWRQHKYWAKNKEVVSKITNAIKKYGVENFEFSIIELCDKDLFEEKERHWIKKYDSVLSGYNLTYGGSIRKIVSDETRLKMSKSKIGVPKSESHKKKIAEANGSKESREKFSKLNLGRKLSDETKKKMSESKKGFRHTEEAKKKMGAASIAHWQRVALQLAERPKVGRPPKVSNELKSDPPG